MDEPSIITTAQLAERMGMAERTVRDWTNEDATLAGCVVRQTRRSTWWSVQKLRDRGYLTKPEAIRQHVPQAQAVAS